MIVDLTGPVIFNGMIHFSIESHSYHSVKKGMLILRYQIQGNLFMITFIHITYHYYFSPLIQFLNRKLFPVIILNLLYLSVTF